MRRTHPSSQSPRRTLDDRVRARDLAMRRLRRATGAVAIGATALSGLFAGLAAHASGSTKAKPIATTPTVASAATTPLPATPAPTTTAEIPTTAEPATPSAPETLPAPTAEPPVAATGGS